MISRFRGRESFKLYLNDNMEESGLDVGQLRNNIWHFFLHILMIYGYNNVNVVKEKIISTLEGHLVSVLYHITST